MSYALPPREIAQRLGVPVNTVHSRLQRGLDQLRAKLDAEHGGREDWLAAFTAIGWPRTSGLFSSGSWIGVSSLMQAKFLFVVAAVVSVVLWFSNSDTETQIGSDVASSVEPNRGRSTRGASSVGDSATSPIDSTQERASATAQPKIGAAGARPLRKGRVVDALGRALEGVPVLHHGALWPRWQNGDLGWINDGAQGLFLPPSKTDALRADPAAAREFFAQFRFPADWRAVVLGEPIEERTQRTDERGEFAFEGVDGNAQFELAGESWMLLAAAEEPDGSALLVAAPAVRVAGRVLDGSLIPLASGTVRARWSPQLALSGVLTQRSLARLWDPQAMNADDEGRFVLRSVPVGLVGCELRAAAKQHEARDVQPPASSRDDFDIVLHGASNASMMLAGIVLDPSGAPVQGADVVFGRESVTTGADGRFAFAAVDPLPSAKLTAIKAEFAPVQRLGFAAQLRADPELGRNIELRFTDNTRTLRGVVLGASGEPLPGVSVNLFDPSLLDITFTPLEGRSSGWDRAVTTDAAGRFELGGLAPRPYRLRVWRPESSLLFVSEPFAAHESDVTVQVSAASAFATVRGQVVSPQAVLSSGLMVAIVYPIHITHGGGGSMTEGTEPAPVDAQGRFELHDVPRWHAEIVIGVRDGAAISVPVEAIGADGTLEIVFKLTRLLRLVGRAEGASASVVDADDVPLEIEPIARGSRTRATVVSAIDGEFAPCVIPGSAVAVLLQRADGAWARIAIEDDSYGLARAMLPR